MSLSTVGRSLQALGLSRKKSQRAAQADPAEQAAFQEAQKTMRIEALIFLDEFGTNLTMTRVYVTEPFHHGSNISVISALRLEGVCAPMRIEGAVNSEVFALYVQPLLVPCLRPGHLVVLDNVKFHSAPKALALIEAAGAQVLYLPAYSPAFNPIEECISKLKTALRSFKARTKRTLTHALAKALALITQADIRGWFEHVGYVFSLN